MALEVWSVFDACWAKTLIKLKQLLTAEAVLEFAESVQASADGRGEDYGDGTDDGVHGEGAGSGVRAGGACDGSAGDGRVSSSRRPTLQTSLT
jgi:hypothetical protein